MMSDEITIRSIQHYMYCPHRWGLLEIDCAWAENVFVTKANFMHERVHNPDKNYSSRGKKVFTAVPVYNDQKEYNLYGVTDCLELTKSPDGIMLNGSTEKYKIRIVEYKPTKPKDKDFREDDAMQLFAQKLCVDYIFGGDCEAAIYYGDVKKRYYFPREQVSEYDDKLKKLLLEMRSCKKDGKIPAIRKGQKCNGCSMKDMCMPKSNNRWEFRKKIEQIRENGGQEYLQEN